MGARQVGSLQTGGESVRRAVRRRDRLFLGVKGLNRQHRAEDPFLDGAGFTKRSTFSTCRSPAIGPTTMAGSKGSPTGTAGSWPKEFSLPNGWGPERVAIGSAPYAYFGSIATGGVYRVDLTRGKGKVVHRGLGRMTVGLKADSWGRLFPAGGSSGELRVVDAHSGALLANHVVAGENSFVNDVLLTRDAAWFTESFSAQLFKLPLGRKGRIGAPESLTLSGDWAQSGFTSNGISLTPEGSALLVTNAAADGGSLMHVNPRTGVARKVDLGDTTLPSGDGLVLIGRRLQGSAYLPNSRFTTPDREENAPYNAVSVPLV